MHHVFFCIVPKLLPFFLYYFSRQKIDKFALKVAQNFCFLTQTHATNNMTKERERSRAILPIWLTLYTKLIF